MVFICGSGQDTILKFKAGEDIHSLFNEKCQLQQFVSRFKNGNEKYLQIKDVAEEQVNRLLTEQESLLDLALKAVIEALRMNPGRYAVIYDSKYDSDDNVSNSISTTNIAISSSHSTCSTSTKPYQNYYYNEYREGILEIAKGFLKILSSQLVDNTMVAAVQDTKRIQTFLENIIDICEYLSYINKRI